MKHLNGENCSKKALFHEVAAKINAIYGEGTAELTVNDSYFNMKEVIEANMYIIDRAKKAMTDVGVTPKVVPIRGGTDGARLSFMGLPCPNLGTGGYGFHGPYEHITVEGMDKAVEIMLGIVRLYQK